MLAIVGSEKRGDGACGAVTAGAPVRNGQPVQVLNQAVTALCCLSRERRRELNGPVGFDLLLLVADLLCHDLASII